MTAAVRIVGAVLARWPFALAVLPAAQAQARTHDNGDGWSSGDVVVRGAVAVIKFDESSEVAFGGTPVTGAAVAVSNSTTLSAEAEFFIKPWASVAVTAGLPPAAKLTAMGTLANAGQIGAVRYGTISAFARFHLQPSKRLSPFAGLGVAHFFPIRVTDGAVSNLAVKADTAVALQAGFDLRVTKSAGLFASATWTPLRTRARGAFGPIPVEAGIRLNPVIVQAGIAFRF